MSRRASTSPREQIISRVIVDSTAMLPATLKYPNGHLCNLPKANRPLMEDAAGALGIEIQFGEPVNVAPRRIAKLTGVYVHDLARAEALMDKYRERLIAAFLERTHKEPSHENEIRVPDPTVGRGTSRRPDQHSQRQGTAVDDGAHARRGAAK